jgi:hypothetical protein
LSVIVHLGEQASGSVGVKNCKLFEAQRAEFLQFSPPMRWRPKWTPEARPKCMLRGAYCNFLKITPKIRLIN